jgi:hypothetical protein
MDTGKIFLGIALIAFSVAMVTNPASAAGCDNSSPVGCENPYTADYGSAAGSLQYADYTAYSDMPALYWINPEILPKCPQRYSS